MTALNYSFTYFVSEACWIIYTDQFFVTKWDTRSAVKQFFALFWNYFAHFNPIHILLNQQMYTQIQHRIVFFMNPPTCLSGKEPSSGNWCITYCTNQLKHKITFVMCCVFCASAKFGVQSNSLYGPWYNKMLGTRYIIIFHSNIKQLHKRLC